MNYSAIIVAAGKGNRMGLGYNKVLYKHNEHLLLEYTLNNFVLDSSCEKIILVINKNDEKVIMDTIKNDKVIFVYGGDSREQSVYNGLKEVKSEYVLIHDGDRPNVSKQLIECVKMALETCDSVIPVIKKEESLNKYGLAKDDYYVQTPEGFKTSLILDAFNQAKNDLDKYKDDSSILEVIKGVKPTLIIGEKINLKVTDKDDLKYIGSDIL